MLDNDTCAYCTSTLCRTANGIPTSPSLVATSSRVWWGCFCCRMIHRNYIYTTTAFYFVRLHIIFLITFFIYVVSTSCFLRHTSLSCFYELCYTLADAVASRHRLSFCSCTFAGLLFSRNVLFVYSHQYHFDASYYVRQFLSLSSHHH